jgi:hypothetical protein
VDLRERVVRAVENGASRRATAAKFEVSISFVVKLMQRWRRRGTVHPGCGWRRQALGACGARRTGARAGGGGAGPRRTIADSEPRCTYSL